MIPTINYTIQEKLAMGAGMCRAHGIAHQAVRSVEELPRALESAWRLNRHSVVEVSIVAGLQQFRTDTESSQLAASLVSSKP